MKSKKNNDEVIKQINVDEDDDFCFTEHEKVVDLLNDKKSKVVGIPVKDLSFQSKDGQIDITEGTVLCEIGDKGRFRSVAIKGKEENMKYK